MGLRQAWSRKAATPKSDMGLGNLKPRLAICSWVAGMILPLYWVSRPFPILGPSYDWILRTEAFHVTAHLALTSILGFLVSREAGRMGLPPRKRAALALLGVMAVGLVQETIQVLIRQRGFGPNEWFDLAVDLAGAFLGILSGRQGSPLAQLQPGDPGQDQGQ